MWRGERTVNSTTCMPGVTDTVFLQPMAKNSCSMTAHGPASPGPWQLGEVPGKPRHEKPSMHPAAAGSKHHEVPQTPWPASRIKLGRRRIISENSKAAGAKSPRAAAGT
ncbi:uncharacterized protein EI97DRAFT_504642 [Westerdykella ornata]|uniref:Uncharacterized protein n=1 Tax=Westerdykella ornata TaxID=318751 RepID=A0A6A6J5Y2_WESOR|nr:uncharacterized protein EI97DRAFT_504642 [Westerdykella ornata]KAF2271845.1 hypothetical protein EI97DRAFT_504642 [Westerdykella ornata]